MRWEGIIRRFGPFFSPVPEDCVVTLLEGNTPLIPAPALARRIAPGTRIHLKYEGQNPTGSFKDRGMTMAGSKARADGSGSVICASTGNTSASAAAYAARAGMRARVFVPASASGPAWRTPSPRPGSPGTRSAASRARWT